MLRRVLAATLSSVIFAVVLLGVPLAVAGVGLTRADAQRSATARADALALELDQLVEVGAPVGVEALDPSVSDDAPGAPWPARVRAQVPGGDLLQRGPGTGDDAGAVGGTVVDDGGRGPLGGVRGEARSGGVAVEVSVSAGQLWAAELRLVVLVAALAAGAVAAGWALAQVQARRMVRPLTDLAATAELLGAGRVPPGRPPTGVEEVDQVAGALEASARRISRVLAAERDFSADASHQLRTPLTALSMRLEEIVATTGEPATAHEAQVALSQVERLTSVVEDLLARSRTSSRTGSGDGSPGSGGGGAGARHDLGAVVAQQAQEWAPVFARAGRRLDVVAPDAATAVLAAPGPVAQALATLLENALTHGAGRVSVRTRTDQHAWVVLEVGDEGPGIPEPLGQRAFERRVSGGAGTGLGLAVARDLVVAEGGRLELVRRAPPVFGIFLRRA